jgi:hypothetical protein
MAIPTPYSYRQYPGDGVAKDFSVPFPYLERAHVHLLLDGKELIEGPNFTWTSGTQVKLTVAPAAAAVLTVRRVTPEDDQIVQWKDGSYIIQDDLNESDRQWLYLLQEHHDALVLLLNGMGSIPGGGSPAASLTFWNNLQRSKDPNKGTPAEIAQTIAKLDQLLGDWPASGGDKYIATTDAISARLDPYVQSTTPAPLVSPQREQPGKLWLDNLDLQQRYWDPVANAWVTLANSGPKGEKGDKGDRGEPGGIVFKGDLDVTAQPPAGVLAGWQYVSSTTGTPHVGFNGLSGTINKGNVLLYSGTDWIMQQDALPGVTAANEAVAGIVELASPLETLTGTDQVRAVHPAGLKGALDLKLDVTTAASTYQTVVGMSSYLTTAAASNAYLSQASAATTYQTQAAMSGYLPKNIALLPELP